GNPHKLIEDLGIVDSGCSRSMTGNRHRLENFQEFKGGNVTFGGGEGKITSKGVKTATTPYEPQKPKDKNGPNYDVNVHLYRSIIGSLVYLIASRPDIMFAVSTCSRFQVTPKNSNLLAVKRIFKYLKGQPKLGLWYPRDSSFELEAYTDSDYARNYNDRKSTTGGCQFLGRRLISWQCKKQTIMATSSTEAEYVVVAHCCGQFFTKEQNTEIWHHFIRDANEKRLIQVLKIHTDQNVADLLTKDFDGPRRDNSSREFQKLRTTKAVRSVPIQEQSTEELKELSEEELKMMLEIVPVEEIKAEALQVKEDLVTLWSLVKERFRSAEPTEDMERALWVELKRLVHHVSSTRGHDIYMLIEKDYPLSTTVMGLMLSRRLQVEEDSEMARDLVMKIFIEANKLRS
ncbi:hypothetical protein Tco_0425201, partial [Tanacetum coccineum]